MTETRYAGWLAGPWIDLTDYDRRIGYRESVAECEVCGREIRMPPRGAPEAEVREVRDVSRTDWEAHVRESAPRDVPYFVLHCDDPYKTPTSGSWADVLRDVPYFLFDGDPIPPLAVVNSVLAEGEVDAGQSGGCQWPRHQLTGDEYPAVREVLADHFSLIDVDEPAPPWVDSETTYRTWKVCSAAGCSRRAAEAWLAAIREAVRIGGDELWALRAGRDQWVWDFDAGNERR